MRKATKKEHEPVNGPFLTPDSLPEIMKQANEIRGNRLTLLFSAGCEVSIFDYYYN